MNIKKREVFNILIILALIFLSGTNIIFKNTYKNVFKNNSSNIIILDAGHGFPDGGAIGINGSIESELNIKITKKLEKKLLESNYKVILTRKGEEALSAVGKSIGEKKRNDMQKRLDILNNSGGNIFLSIHMNKFTDSRYRGAQVIYSDNTEESQFLAKEIQEEMNKLKENKGKRNIMKTPGNLYLLKYARIPAIIIECGFLSNFEEEQNLNNPKYQNKLVDSIVKGIENYNTKLKGAKNENYNN